MQVWQICRNFFTKRPRSFHQTPEKFTKVTARKDPFPQNFLPDEWKAILLSSKKCLCQISKNISLKAKSHHKISLCFQKLSSLKKLLRRCRFRFWQHFSKISPREWNLSTSLPKHSFKEVLSCAKNYNFFLRSCCRQLEWNFDNSARKICQTSEKF